MNGFRNQEHHFAKVLLAVLFVAVLSVPMGAVANRTNNQGGFNQPGNLLVTDQFNNRVVEIDPHTRSIVWSFGSNDPSPCNPGPGAIIGTNDAERLANDL